MNNAAVLYYGLFAVLILAIRIGLMGMFKKAGEQGWKAFIPVYSDYIWLQLIGKPTWWVVLTLIPVIRTLIKISMNIEIAKAFGKYTFGQHTLAVLLPFYLFPKIAFDDESKYLGPPDEHKNVPPKSGIREWADAFLYAAVAALIIRTFFIEAFMIPTSSMERTLMAGDFLFVSKFHYGPRMPMIPLAVPFVHNKIKIGNTTIPSYLDVVRLPYFRFPGIEEVERNDIVVFNYPAHDISDLNDGAGLVKPVSLKENYIKRCVAVPGDTLEIKDQQIYINGSEGYNPTQMQYQYKVTTDGTGFPYSRMKELGFRKLNSKNNNYRQVAPNLFEFWMPKQIADKVRQFSNVKAVEVLYEPAGKFTPNVYPQFGNMRGQLLSHNIDNFGPILIPAKGMTIPLNSKNISLYYRVIDAYEDHDLEIDVANERALVDGQPAESYTFEMDYYFMMGDNRHNSEDSRYWGFVPENHVVGKPLFIFFSYESGFGIRFSRIGTQHIQ